jgi:U3 small nucleolar RNA-associated protein 3
LGKRSGGVSSANVGGDADLPYKKKNSKIPEEIEPESANKEEEDYEEGLEKSMADIYGEISDHSSEEEGQEDANVEFDEEDEDSLYYNTIKAQKQSKKNAREELYAQIHAPLQDSASLVRPDEQDLPLDTKRKATYHILKNRGLTPYRKKEIKNPRVKRRLKYEGALKKLSSVRRVAVDKSKVSTHKYAGEKTGIKSNLSRSTKF